MTDNMRGILAILAASAAFVLNDTLVKLVTAELPTGELIAIRGAMATALILMVAWAKGALASPRVLLAWPMAVRVVAASISTLCIVLALKHMPLAIVTSVLQVTPVIVTLGSALLFKEEVGWKRWATTIAGFAGVLLIVQPGAAGLDAYAFIAFAALIFTTTRDLTTRLIDKSVSSLFVAGASSALITLVGCAFVSVERWVTPTPRALGMLALASVCLLFAYTLIIYAMRTGQLSVVAPFRYTLIPLSLLLGYLIWGDVPNALAWAGIAVVMGSGLYALQAERLSTRAAPRSARPSERPSP